MNRVRITYSMYCDMGKKDKHNIQGFETSITLPMRKEMVDELLNKGVYNENLRSTHNLIVALQKISWMQGYHFFEIRNVEKLPDINSNSNVTCIFKQLKEREK